jgi:glycosyltransferase involved in cell wall biosynthesis
MQRIVYVIDSLGPGGAERQLLYLLASLDRTRYEPYVLTVHDEQTVPYHYQAEIAALNIPIYTLHMPLPIGRVIWLLTAIGRYVGFMWRLRPHLVQSNLYVSNVIARLSRPFCPPQHFINTIHSVEGRNRLQVLRWTEWLCPLTITNSPKTHRLYQAGGIPAAKLQLIPCGFEVARFSQLPAFSLRAEIAPDATFLALVVARIHREKDHLTLLKALATIKTALPVGFRLMLLGGVMQADVHAELVRYIAQEQLGQWVQFQAAVRDTERYYAAADVTILPSERESFGLVVVESLAAGVPVVISDAANALDVIETDKTGWVFPTGDAQALANCLLEAIQMLPEQRAAMGARGQLAAQAYSVEKMTAAYQALYQQLMAQ